MIRNWLLVAALCLPGAAAAQDGGVAGWQTFDLPSQSFGDDSDLGKYNYLGKVHIPDQIPGMGSPYVIDSETLRKLYCPNGTCPDLGVTPSYRPDFAVPSFRGDDWSYILPATPVADDEIRLDNPQPIELGLRLTVGGVPGVVSIKATESYSHKLSAGSTAVAEIASGSTVTTISLQPGKAYAIQVVNGAYFIVPNN